MKHSLYLTRKRKSPSSWHLGVLGLIACAGWSSADCSMGYLPRVGPVPLAYNQPKDVPTFEQSVAWLDAQVHPKPSAPTAAQEMVTTTPPEAATIAPTPVLVDHPPNPVTPPNTTQIDPHWEHPVAPEPVVPQPAPNPLITPQMLVPFFTSSASNSSAVMVVPTFVPPLPPVNHSSTASYRVEPP